MTKLLSVALVQQQNTTDVEQNLRHSQQAIRAAAAEGAQLIVLSELHQSLYFCQTEDAKWFESAETIPGPTTDQLAAWAKAHQVVLVGSVFERCGERFYNTAVVFDTDGRLAGRYRKMHIPYDPDYYEKFYFTPGDQGFTPIATSCGKLGVMVCFDQWFPEAARAMVLNGAEVLIYPTAIGWLPTDAAAEKNRQLEAWTTIQRSHAIANLRPVIACNRVGFEAHPLKEDHGIQFWGHSFICGPQGEVLAQAGTERPETLRAQLDLTRGEALAEVWTFPRDRRPDCYRALIQPHSADRGQ